MFEEGRIEKFKFFGRIIIWLFKIYFMIRLEKLVTGNDLVWDKVRRFKVY